MKVLLIHRHYWPDTPPYASILKSIAEALAAEGHNVSVYSALPSYKSVDQDKAVSTFAQEQGVRVHRKALLKEKGRPVWFRLFNMLYFPLRVFLHILLRSRYDVVMVSTAPPVILGFMAALAARLKGSRFVYNCMDIHPEIGRLSGEFGNPAVFNTMMHLDSWTCHHADLVVVLSRDMQQALLERPGKRLSTQIEIINNFEVDDDGDADPSIRLDVDQHRTSLVFAGNIGRFQNLDLLLDLLSDTRLESRLELFFIGEGAFLSRLKERVERERLAHVHFVPHQNVATSKRLIAQCDLGVVSLQKDVSRYAFPSKTFTYLSQGVPVLLLAERHSSLADLIDSNQIGIVVDPGSFKEGRVGFENLVQSPERLKQMSDNALRYSQQVLSREHVLASWKHQFNQLKSD